MRFFFFSLCICLSALKVFGQKEGEKNYPILCGITDYNYRFDFSKAEIDGRKFDDYIEYESLKSDDDFDVFKQKYISKIQKAFLLGIKESDLDERGVRLNNKGDSPVEIVIYLKRVDDDGEQHLDVYLFDKSNEQEIVMLEIHSDSGRFAGFETLFLRKLKTSGKKFGNKLDKLIDSSCD